MIIEGIWSLIIIRTVLIWYKQVYISNTLFGSSISLSYLIALWNRHNICNAIAHVRRQRNANILLTRYLKVNWGVNYKILINKHVVRLIALVHYCGRKISSSNVTKYLKTMIIKRVIDDMTQICRQMIKLHVYMGKIVILFYFVG